MEIFLFSCHFYDYNSHRVYFGSNADMVVVVVVKAGESTKNA